MPSAPPDLPSACGVNGRRAWGQLYQTPKRAACPKAGAAGHRVRWSGNPYGFP